LDKEVVEKICSEYGLPSFYEKGNLGGLSTINSIIKVNRREFVLKQYSEKNINKMEKIERITFFLKGNNFPIAVPIRTNKGDYYVETHNLLFVLYPKINGRILYENSLTEKSLVNTAMLLQIFHTLGEKCSFSFEKNILSLHEFLQKAQDCKNIILNNTLGYEIDDLILSFINKKISIVKKGYRENFFKSEMQQNDLVHGDFHNENILYNLNDEIVCLLDFEEVHHGYGVEDLMKFIQLACCNTGYQKDNLKKASIFLKAYLSKRFVKKETLIFYANCYMYHIASSFFFEKKLYLTKNIGLLDYIKRDLFKLSYLEQHADLFVEQLLSC